MDYGYKLFNMVNWNVSKDTYYYAVGLLGIWITAIVFLILSWVNAGDPADAQKQKNFNIYASIVLLAILLCIYLSTVVGSNAI